MKTLARYFESRGFFRPSAHIYGGLDGVFDYGHLGVELKNNLKSAWWRSMVYDRDDIEGMDGALLSHPFLLEYSGHIAAFDDPMSYCERCDLYLRTDQLVGGACTTCGDAGRVLSLGQFNMMLGARLGPRESATGSPNAYFRPATAQHTYANFKWLMTSANRQLPFGLVQIGKAFRNEILPTPFLFRMREFEQMELQYFVPPETDERWHEYWLETRLAWWAAQGLRSDRIRVDDVKAKDLAHYSKRTLDIYYRFDDELWGEIEGIANRTDYDLTCHSKLSGRADLVTFSKLGPNQHSDVVMDAPHPETRRPVIPWVIEPAAGVDRGVAAVLCESHQRVRRADGIERTVLKIKRHLAPVKAAILVEHDDWARDQPKVQRLKEALRALGLGKIAVERSDQFEASCASQDEIGTPVCLWFVNSSPQLRVAVRERDGGAVKTLELPGVAAFLRELFGPQLPTVF